MTSITKRQALAGAGALAAQALAAPLAQAQIPAAAATPLPRVVVETPLGAITIELASDKAPITCANFLRYVDAKRLDGGTFYRALKLAPNPLAGLIQGGLKNDPAKAFPAIAHESTKTTGLSHKDGAVSMARYDPGTATSEFFVCIGDIVSLDADPTQPGDNQGFAVFGHVVAGMDTARKILVSPVSATAGDASMKGQMLDPEIAITSVHRA
jgi:peptidyl-prolyl cis-trans isomerase A (cyclophilin A)